MSTQEQITPINQQQAYSIISLSIGPYFFSFIGGLILGPFLGMLIYPIIFNEPLPPSNSQLYQILLVIFMLIFTPIFMFYFIENYASKYGIDLSGTSFRTFRYTVILFFATFGLAIGVNSLLTYFFKIFLGKKSIVAPEGILPYTLQGQLQYLAIIAQVLPVKYRFLVLSAILLQFVAFAYLFKGLLGGALRKWKTGAATVVLVPALVETIMLNIDVLFRKFSYYALYLLLTTFIYSFFAGVLFWMTRSARPVIFYYVLYHFVDVKDPLHTMFFLVLPEWMGEYDLRRAPQTLADSLDIFIQNTVFFIVVLSFLLPFLFFPELGKFVLEFYYSLKKQWFGILIVTTGLVALELIFYLAFQYIGGNGFFMFILAFFIGGLFVSLAFRVIFSFLPPPQSMEQVLLMTLPEKVIRVIEPNPAKDILALQGKRTFFEKPIPSILLAETIFLYLFFISNAFNLTWQVLISSNTTFLTKISTLFFRVVTPLVLLALMAYANSRFQYHKPVFYSAWQARMNKISWFLITLTAVVYVLWASLLETHVKLFGLIPFFIRLSIITFPDELKEKYIASFSTSQRYTAILHATRNYPSVKNTLLELEKENLRYVQGIALAINAINNNTSRASLKTYLESDNPEVRYGACLAVGFLKAREYSKSIIQLFKDEDYLVRYCAVWAFGVIGSSKQVSRLVRAIERETSPDIRELAKQSIQKIDPSYPIMSILETEEPEYYGEEI